MTIKPRTHFTLDTLALIVLLVVLLSGLLLWAASPQGGAQGSRRHGDSAAAADPTAILGLSKGDLRDVHLWGGLIFAGVVLVHLVLHWKWIACQSRRLTGRSTPPAPRPTEQHPHSARSTP